jgi:hypothetical protein
LKLISLPNNRTMKTFKITGEDAIRLAERDGLTIHCEPNVVMPDGGVVNAAVARGIIHHDGADTIFIEVQQHGWVIGGVPVSERPKRAGFTIEDFFNESGMYLGPMDDRAEPRWDDAPEGLTAVISADYRGDYVTEVHKESSGRYAIGGGPVEKALRYTPADAARWVQTLGAGFSVETVE